MNITTQHHYFRHQVRLLHKSWDPKYTHDCAIRMWKHELSYVYRAFLRHRLERAKHFLYRAIVQFVVRLCPITASSPPLDVILLLKYVLLGTWHYFPCINATSETTSLKQVLGIATAAQVAIGLGCTQAIRSFTAIRIYIELLLSYRPTPRNARFHLHAYGSWNCSTYPRLGTMHPIFTWWSLRRDLARQMSRTVRLGSIIILSSRLTANIAIERSSNISEIWISHLVPIRASQQEFSW